MKGHLKQLAVLALLGAALAGIFWVSPAGTENAGQTGSGGPSRALEESVASQNLKLGQRTKTSGCVLRGKLPDPDCTPGDVFYSTPKSEICSPGYSGKVRDVPISVKNQVYAEYGIDLHLPGEYEIDHLIPLSIGGSNDISNLWPEPARPAPGFHEKDAYEFFLYKEVCDGDIGLREAERRMATDWLANWSRDMNPSNR